MFCDMPIKLYIRSGRQSEPLTEGGPTAISKAVGTQDLDEPDAELTASSSHPDVEGMKFLDREVNELLWDFED